MTADYFPEIGDICKKHGSETVTGYKKHGTAAVS